MFRYAVALLHNVQVWTRLKTNAGDVFTAQKFTSSEALLDRQVSEIYSRPVFSESRLLEYDMSRLPCSYQRLHLQSTSCPKYGCL